MMPKNLRHCAKIEDSALGQLAFQVCDRFVIMSHGTKVFDVAKADTTINQLTEYVVLT